MASPERFAQVEVSTVEALHAWLGRHHGQAEAVWLVTWKKAVAARYVPHEAVMDELVSFGWIDGIRRRVDDERTMQLISPRRAQPWAKSYKDRAERLIAEGRMQPSGLAGVEDARASGAWHAMDAVDALLVPDDLAGALAASPPAPAVFAGFPPSTRRNLLRWIASARTDVTREKRIGLTVTEAAQGRAAKSHG